MARILAVDDQLTIRELVEAILKPHGHEVDTAENGRVALQLAEKSTYDLVISDVNMPHMNGITLVGELRRLTEYKYTPILVLTTESGDEIKNTARKTGASGWLTKPFDSHRLASAVKRLLAKYKEA